NHVARDAGLALGALEGVRLDARPERVVTRRRPPDELLRYEPLVDDHARHRVREGDVAADVEAEPHVRPRGAARAARVHDVETRAAADALEEMMEEDRMCVARVRSPEEDD